ncbi:hypothetical protein M8C21_015569, partial [Ambrosia artemisiifolia]
VYDVDLTLVEVFAGVNPPSISPGLSKILATTKERTKSRINGSLSRKPMKDLMARGVDSGELERIMIQAEDDLLVCTHNKILSVTMPSMGLMASIMTSFAVFFFPIRKATLGVNVFPAATRGQ